MDRVRQPIVKRVRRETHKHTALKEKTILSMSNLWHARLPESTLLEVQDLSQEGWLVDQECFVNFDPEKGMAYNSYLWAALNWKFRIICNKEWKRVKTESEALPPDSLLPFTILPDDHYNTKEVMRELSGISPEFVEIIMSGLTKDMFLMLKREQRIKRHKQGWSASNAKFSFDRKLFKTIFGEIFTELECCYYNNVK